MAGDNVEIFRRSLEAFDRGDRDTWIELTDPDLEIIPAAIWPEAGVIRGAEAGWDFYVRVTEPFERASYGADAEVVASAGEKLLVHQRTRLRGRASGADVELDFWVVLTYRKGRTLRAEWFTNRADAEFRLES